jgi:nucleotide-binding universal stress UspA family protein
VPLSLVHVVDAPLPEWFEVAAPAGFRQSQEQRARDFIESAIKIAEESTAEFGPVQIDSNVLNSAIVPTFVDLSTQVEMVVVGYRGHGGVVARSFLGSVSSALVHHAHCPVAVIHEDGAMTGNRPDEVSTWRLCTPGLIPGFPAPRACSKTPNGTLGYPRRRRRSLNGWRVGTNAIPTWRSVAESKLAIRHVG